MPVVPQVTQLRPADAFRAIREAGLQPVLLGVPRIKSDGNTGYQVVAAKSLSPANQRSFVRWRSGLIEPHLL